MMHGQMKVKVGRRITAALHSEEIALKTIY